MGFDQYHEPPDELPAATRTFARLCASLTEEAEAIGWYEQRIAVETDREALEVMRDAQGEEGDARDVAPHAGLPLPPARLLDPPVGLGLAHGRVESSLAVAEGAPAAARLATISGGEGGSIFRRRTCPCADR